MSEVGDHKLSFKASTREYYCNTCNKVVKTILEYHICGTEPYRFCENKILEPIKNGPNK